MLARVTGLEPATSGVTGRRSNQLSYTRNGRGQRLGWASSDVKGVALRACRRFEIWSLAIGRRSCPSKRRACSAAEVATLVGGDGFEPPALSV